MPLNTVRHKGNLSTANTDINPSPGLWGDFPFDDILAGVTPGYARHIDFNRTKLSTNINAAEAYWADGLKAFGSDGATVSAVDAIGGGVTIGSDGDNEGASFGMATYPFQISRSHKTLVFEASVKTSTITDTKHGFFLGLIDSSALSATVPIAAAGTLADENLVGFHRLEGDGDYVDTVYKANGVTQVTVQSDAQVLVADTWIKLGFKYEPQNTNGSYILTFYADNLPLTTTYQVASADGTDFPNDVRLGFVFAVLNATASTPGTSSIRWARIAQLH